MTTTTLTTNQRLQVVKHLAGGKTPDVVAAITGLDRSTVVDVGNHHGYPDRDKLAWARDILAKKASDAQSALPDKTTEHLAEQSTSRPPRPTAAAPAPSRPVAAASTPAATGPNPERQLIDAGLEHPGKRIQAAARKVLDDLDKLRGLIAEDEQKHAAKRKAEAEKARARAEVERLEQELAAAKAKLRTPKTPAAKKSTPAKAPRERGPLDFACRNDGCDKAYDTAQGRSMHERLRCEHRQQEAS